MAGAAGPDWIAEVLSASTKKRDLGVKMRAYHHTSVGHYWVVDSQSQVFYVYRWSPRAYEVALTAFIGDRVRAEPFEAVEIDVGRLFGVEEEDGG